MADQISMKFCVDIICRTRTYRTIQSYLPVGAALPDCFANFSNPLTMVRFGTPVVGTPLA